MAELKVVVIGGSIGGFAAAIAFHRFSGRGGSIGFCQVPLWEQLRGASMIRRGQRASRAQGGWIYGDLWDFLYDGLPQDTVVFAQAVTDLGDDPNQPTVLGEIFDVAVVADGGWSELRGLYFEQTLPVYAGYEVWRFRVEADSVPGFRAFGEYSSSRFSTILLDICLNNGPDFIMGGTAVAVSEAEVPTKGSNRQVPGDGASATLEATESESQRRFLMFYKETFGSHSNGELYRVMETAARKGKIARLAQYEFAASKVVSGRIVLVGDAAHMASPRTASGAHTAVLDGHGLFDAFSQVTDSSGSGGGDWGAVVDLALAKYGPLGLSRAQQLVQRSIQVSSPLLPKEFKRGDQLYLPPLKCQ